MSASAAMQEYLAEAYRLAYYQNGEPFISTSALADVMRVSAPAVTRMVQRLKEAGYLEHEPYRGVHLTPAGEREALMSIRRHRLVEVFLVKVMQFGWHEVHDQADELGVVISDEVVNRMDKHGGLSRAAARTASRSRRRKAGCRACRRCAAQRGRSRAATLVISRVNTHDMEQAGISGRTRLDAGARLHADLARAVQRTDPAATGRRDAHDRLRAGGRAARLPAGRVRVEVSFQFSSPTAHKKGLCG